MPEAEILLDCFVRIKDFIFVRNHERIKIALTVGARIDKVERDPFFLWRWRNIDESD